MPEISWFYGIRIKMNHRDIGRHNLPHIHAEYQEFEAVYSIPDGQLLIGELPRRQKNMVEEWIEQHRNELVRNWRLAIVGEGLFKIDPLV
jgi:hypothetical protein